MRLPASSSALVTRLSLPMPCQQQQAIVQIFALDQHVNRQHQHEDALAKWLHDRARHGAQQFGDAA